MCMLFQANAYDTQQYVITLAQSPRVNGQHGALRGS